MILPRCKLALDIGRCPQPSVYQQTVLITHGHLDHIGGVTFHAASRWAQEEASLLLTTYRPLAVSNLPPAASAGRNGADLPFSLCVCVCA